MYVCVCNAVTDRQIRAQSESSRGTVAEVYRALGIKVKCGKCVSTAKCIIGEMRPAEMRPAEMLPGVCAGVCAVGGNRNEGLRTDARRPLPFAAYRMSDGRVAGRQPETRNAARSPAFVMAD